MTVHIRVVTVLAASDNNLEIICNRKYAVFFVYTITSLYSSSAQWSAKILGFFTPRPGGDGSKNGSTLKDIKVFSSDHKQIN